MKRTVIVLLWIIIIEKMSNDTIWLKPDLRDTKGN